jgi:sortase A
LRNKQHFPCGIIRLPMSRPKSPGDLSEGELRRLLLDKRRVARRDRLERFRRTGRVIALAPEAPTDAGDEAGADEAATETGSRPEGRRWFDRALLVIEVVAALGFIAVLLGGVNVLRMLNAEVAQAIRLPTLTATPFITAVVLPSGHTPPTAPEGAQPNESEIPEHLRPLVQSLANVPIPTAGLDQAVRIQVPALGLDAPVVQGDGWEQLKKGVAQHLGTANPGEDGNVVLSAHNDIFGELFRYLDKLKAGDEVIIHTNQRQYVYEVTDTRIVEPTAVEVMAPTTRPVVTLISCYPYLIDNQRIVVRARLQNP